MRFIIPPSAKLYIIQPAGSPAPALPKHYDDLFRFHYYGICRARNVDVSIGGKKPTALSDFNTNQYVENSHCK